MFFFSKLCFLAEKKRCRSCDQDERPPTTDQTGREPNPVAQQLEELNQDTAFQFCIFCGIWVLLKEGVREPFVCKNKQMKFLITSDSAPNYHWRTFPVAQRQQWKEFNQGAGLSVLHILQLQLKKDVFEEGKWLDHIWKYLGVALKESKRIVRMMSSLRILRIAVDLKPTTMRLVSNRW